MNSNTMVNQQFGNRIVIRDRCVDDDWLKLGLKIPSRKDKYRLTKCMNCGSILPCEIGNLRKQPPKRCVFCSNIGNHSGVEVKTNAWTVYYDCAVCNILYNGTVISAYIDADLYESASKLCWRISKKRSKYYVVSGSAKKGTLTYLHSFVMGGAPDGKEIDHIDGNSLNNRRANLRVVDRQTNIDNLRATRIDNSIGIRGITINKNTGKYLVDFYYHGRRYYSKEWPTIEEAAWYRYYMEDHFGIPAIKCNPLAAEYLAKDGPERKAVHDYVYQSVLGNER